MKKIILSCLAFSIFNLAAFNSSEKTQILQVLTNVYEHAATLPESLDFVHQSSRALSRHIKCLATPGQGICLQNGCPNKNTCINTLIGDIKNFINQLNDALLGHVSIKDSDAIYNSGTLVIILELLSKIPVILAQNAGFDNSKIHALTTKVEALQNKVQALALRFKDMDDFLSSLQNSIDYQIPPQENIVDFPLPKVNITFDIQQEEQKEEIPTWLQQWRGN